MQNYSVCAIVVTHAPDGGFSNRLQHLDSQVAHALVIYNGHDSVPGDAPQGEKRTLLAHPSNNLAAAQNLGIRRARDMGHTHILLMDDDSEPAPNMVKHLVSLFENGHATGLAAANLQEQDTPRHVKHLCSGSGVFGWRKAIKAGMLLPDIVTAIASGSLISLDAIEQCGLMDETLVIDYVDKEYCLRLRTRGYTIAMHGDAILKHRIGKATQHGPITCLNHPPERRYTIWRNRCICIGRYGNIHVFGIADTLGMLYDLIRVIGFEEHKKMKLKAMWHGFLDACLGEKRGMAFPLREYGDE